MHSKRQALIALNAGIFVMTFAPLSAKLIPWPAETIILGRMALGAPALLLFLHWRRKAVTLAGRKDVLLMAVLGSLLALHWVTYFMANKVSTVAVAIIAVHTHPIMSTFLEPLLSHETLERKHILLSVVAFLGVALMVPELSLGNSVVQGVLLSLLSALLFSLRNIWSRRAVKQYGGGVVMFWQLAFGALLLSPVALSIDFRPEPVHIAELLVLAVVATALAHTLVISSLSQLSARTAGVLSSIQPLYGIILALLIFGEAPPTRVLLGGALVLGVVVTETLGQRMPRLPPQTAVSRE